MPLFIEYAQKFRRFQRNARLYLISNILSGVTTGILLVLYNLYLASLGYGADFIGVILFVATLGAGLAIFPAGLCVDRFGGKLILIGSNLLIGVAGAGQIVFRQPIPLLITGFLVGIGGAFILVVNAPFLTLNSTPGERSVLFSVNIVLGLVTTVLGKVLGGVLPLWLRASSWLMAPLPPWLTWLLVSQLVARSYELALLFAGAIAVPSLIPLFLLSDDRPGLRYRRRGGSGVGLGELAGGEIKGRSLGDCVRRVAHDRDIDSAPLGSAVARAAGATAGPPLRNPATPAPTEFLSHIQLRLILRSPIFLLSLTQVLIGLGAGLFIPYFNLYFVQHLGTSSALFGLVDGGATAITALFTLGAPLLAVRLGKVSTIALTELASIPLLLILGLTNNLPVAAVVYLFRYGLMDMSVGIFQVFSMEVAPVQHRGLANSSYQASFQIAWALMAPLGGLIIVHLGYMPIFVAATVCYTLSVGVLWGWFGGRRGQSQ